jgi:hypothetical protein
VDFTISLMLNAVQPDTLIDWVLNACETLFDIIYHSKTEHSQILTLNPPERNKQKFKTKTLFDG